MTDHLHPRTSSSTHTRGSKRLRRDDPVHWVDDRSAWFVTRYDDIRFLLGGGEGVTPDSRAWNNYVPPPEGTYLAWMVEHSLFALNVSDHRWARRLVTTALTPRAIARMDEQISAVVERFAAPLTGRTGLVDVVAEFTDVIPGTVLRVKLGSHGWRSGGAILGLPFQTGRSPTQSAE